MTPRSGDIEEFDDASAAPGVWCYAKASRVRVVIDGEEYFDLVRQAMLKARQRILLVGWDFDTRIHFSRGRRWFEMGWKRTYPARLGGFFLWLIRHRPELEIRILKWSYSVLSMVQRGTMLIDLLRWAPRRRIDFKFDTAHPVGCCHHQKIVVIDSGFAVCGGIDLTGARWDTRDHLPQNTRRRLQNGAPYGPWHDLTMMMEGDIALALDWLGRERWLRAGGKALAPPSPSSKSAWPDKLAAHFENVELGIARTRAEYEDLPKVDEVERLFVQQIAAAKRFVYVENQYFASRAVCEAIAERLERPDPPEFVIVHPEGADDWIESIAMDGARSELVSAIRALDQSDRFHLFVPMHGDTSIYVHAKLMIVDDRVLRIGSANFNNRSMGLDTECDIFIDADRPANGHVEPDIRKIRLSLLAEHCGISESEVASRLEEAGSMSAMISTLGQSRARYLRPFHPQPESSIAGQIARWEVLDPEDPKDLFEIFPAKRGLFRKGSLLAKASAKAKAKLRRKLSEPDE